MQEPVGIKREQVSLIAAHRLAKRPIEQPHVLKREGARFAGHFILHVERQVLLWRRSCWRWHGDNQDQHQGRKPHTDSPFLFIH